MGLQNESFEEEDESTNSANRNGGKAAAAPEAKVDVTGKLLDQVTKEKHELFEKNEKLEKRVQMLDDELSQAYKQIDGLKKALDVAKANPSTPNLSAQDLVVNLLTEQTGKVRRHKDASWSDPIALDRFALTLELILELLTPETKIANSGLVTEAAELKMNMITRSERIRAITVALPSKYGINLAQFSDENVLADALDCPVRATNLRNELSAQQPESDLVPIRDNLVTRLDGAINILTLRKREEERKIQEGINQHIQGEMEKMRAFFEVRSRQAQQPQAAANNPADEARLRKEAYDREQQEPIAPVTPTAPVQPAVKTTMDELIELISTHYVITGVFLLLLGTAIILLAN